MNMDDVTSQMRLQIRNLVKTRIDKPRRQDGFLSSRAEALKQLANEITAEIEKR